MANSEMESEEVHAVSLKLPKFWTPHARVWFAQTEAEFSLRKITVDQTKFHYVLAALDHDTAERILDLLESPPVNGKYDALKARLLETFTLSDYEKAGHILHMPSLGDAKPSALMDKMLSFLGPHQACFLFRRAFLERMPEEIRGTLVHSGETDLRALAIAADRLWEARPHSMNVVRNENRKNYEEGGNLCYHHHTYGDKAHRCKPHCRFFSTFRSPRRTDRASRIDSGPSGKGGAVRF